MRATTRTGFTIVELLVVVAIIGLLIGLLLPALAKIKEGSRRAVEQSAARQMLVAYQVYSEMNRGQVMPGYLVGLAARDANGVPIDDFHTAVVGARYPWRLAPYLDYHFEAMYVNEAAENLEAMKATNYDSFVYAVSLFPSLGLNATWLGGHQGQLGFNQVALDAYGSFYIRHLSSVQRSDKLLVFASARGHGGEDAPGGFAREFPGYFEVRSPRFTASTGDRWEEEYSPSLPPHEFGFVSFRYSREAVVAYVDGHVDARTPDQLRDMRHWSPHATSEDWVMTPDE